MTYSLGGTQIYDFRIRPSEFRLSTIWVKQCITFARPCRRFGFPTSRHNGCIFILWVLLPITPQAACADETQAFCPRASPTKAFAPFEPIPPKHVQRPRKRRRNKRRHWGLKEPNYVKGIITSPLEPPLSLHLQGHVKAPEHPRLVDATNHHAQFFHRFRAPTRKQTACGRLWSSTRRFSVVEPKHAGY